MKKIINIFKSIFEWILAILGIFIIGYGSMLIAWALIALFALFLLWWMGFFN